MSIPFVIYDIKTGEIISSGTVTDLKAIAPGSSQRAVLLGDSARAPEIEGGDPSGNVGAPRGSFKVDIESGKIVPKGSER